MNDVDAAEGLGYTYTEFPTTDPGTQGQQFVDFCRTQIDLGNIVVAGFFDAAGTLDYDHIMPVVGYKKDTNGVTLGIYYNDLYVTTSSRYLSVASDIKN